MMRASHKQPGFWAALIHRLAGLALVVFIPMHFLALGTALSGATRLQSFFEATNTPLVKLAELGIVVALAAHLTLGLRLLAIEFAGIRERTAAAVSACLAAAAAVGLVFLLNVG